MSVTKLTEDEVAKMLSRLREHFGQPVLPVSKYCESFRVWARAIEMAVERTEGTPDHAMYRDMLDRLDVLRLDVNKSNLLYRLLYLGEELRRVPCPTHKGVWSGRAYSDQACPYCMSGSNVTGWIAEVG